MEFRRSLDQKEQQIETSFGSGDKLDKQSSRSSRLCNFQRMACFTILGLLLFLGATIFYSAGSSTDYKLSYCQRNTCTDKFATCKMEVRFDLQIQFHLIFREI